MICLQRAEYICLIFSSELYLSRWEAANSPVPPYNRNKVLRGLKLSSAVFVATPFVAKLEPCSVIGKYSLWFHKATAGFALWKIWGISSLGKVFWMQTKDEVAGRKEATHFTGDFRASLFPWFTKWTLVGCSERDPCLGQGTHRAPSPCFLKYPLIQPGEHGVCIALIAKKTVQSDSK